MRHLMNFLPLPLRNEVHHQTMPTKNKLIKIWTTRSCPSSCTLHFSSLPLLSASKTLTQMLNGPRLLMEIQQVPSSASKEHVAKKLCVDWNVHKKHRLQPRWAVVRALDFTGVLARHNATFPPPIQEYGKAVIASILFFVSVGFASIFVIKGKSENYFVAGRSLPLWVRILPNRFFKVVILFTPNFILSRWLTIAMIYEETGYYSYFGISSDWFQCASRLCDAFL